MRDNLRGWLPMVFCPRSSHLPETEESRLLRPHWGRVANGLNGRTAAWPVFGSCRRRSLRQFRQPLSLKTALSSMFPLIEESLQ